MTSLYVHVPFCAHKCEYCAFYSETPEGALVNRYVDALVAELGMVSANLRPDTIFFGGGTPSILNLRQWTAIFRAMERQNLLGAREWTVECNPATVSSDKAKLFREFGVNRISLGVQSLEERLLERLGRIHSRDAVFKSFDILRAAGFANINLDLMFGIPGQEMQDWRDTLRDALALGSEHLSSYEVIYEEDTPLFAQLRAGRFSVNEDLTCAMYEALLETTAAGGFEQYEIANFARKTARDAGEFPLNACRHNINYWRGGSFYGLGPSAAGYVGGIRTKNFSNTIRYCDEIEKGNRAIESSEELGPLARAGELAAFGLRMNAGWPLHEFRRLTGYDLASGWAQEIEQLVERGYGDRSGDRFRLTPSGLRFADWAAEQFLRI